MYCVIEDNIQKLNQYLKKLQYHFENNKYFMFCCVCVVSLLFVGLLYFTTPLLNDEHPIFQEPWDLHKYIYMAEFPLQLRIAPFCYRFLQPLIVWILPFDLFTGFCIVTSLSIAIAGILMFYILKALHFHYWYCLMGVVFFFSTGWATRFNIFATWHVDAFSYIFVLLSFFLILKGKNWQTAIALLVGVLVKESVIFILPLYYTINTRKIIHWHLMLKTILVGLPAIVVLLSLHLLFPPLNYDETYVNEIPYETSIVTIWTHPNQVDPDVEISRTYGFILFKYIGIDRLENISLSDLKQASFGIWGAMLLFILIGYKQNFNFFIRFFPFLILVYSQVLFAVHFERLLILAFPVMIPMFIAGMNKVGDILQVHPIFLFPLPVILFALILSISNDYEFMPEIRIQFYIILLWFVYLFFISNVDVKKGKIYCST